MRSSNGAAVAGPGRASAPVLGVLLAVLMAAGCDQSPPTTGDTTSGTESWGKDQRLTSDPGASQLSFNFAWSVAVDGLGSIHVVWYDTRVGTSRVYHKRSTDGGSTWGPDTRLSGDQAVGEHPAAAASGSNVYVVWHESGPGGADIHFRRSTDAGITWGPDSKLTASGKSMHPSMAASGSSVHVVWMDNRDGQTEIYTRRSTDAGATWGAETRLSALPFNSWVPSIAASGQNVYAAWVDLRDGNEEEYFRRSADSGATWGPETRLTHDGADSWAPSIAASADTVHVVWFDRRDAGVSHFDVEEKVDEALQLVGLPIEPAPPTDPSMYYLPPLMRRMEEKVKKVQAAAPGWVRSGGDPDRLEAKLKEFERTMNWWTNGWEIYYKRSADGGATWGPDIRLTNAPSVSQRPSIAVSGINLHVVWFDERDGNFEVYYKHSPDGGNSWRSDTRLTDAPGASMHPTIAARDDSLHVVWFDERDGSTEIYYKHRLALQ